MTLINNKWGGSRNLRRKVCVVFESFFPETFVVARSCVGGEILAHFLSVTTSWIIRYSALIILPQNLLEAKRTRVLIERENGNNFLSRQFHFSSLQIRETERFNTQQPRLVKTSQCFRMNKANREKERKHKMRKPEMLWRWIYRRFRTRFHNSHLSHREVPFKLPIYSSISFAAVIYCTMMEKSRRRGIRRNDLRSGREFISRCDA